MLNPFEASDLEDVEERGAGEQISSGLPLQKELPDAKTKSVMCVSSKPGRGGFPSFDSLRKDQAAVSP